MDFSERAQGKIALFLFTPIIYFTLYLFIHGIRETFSSSLPMFDAGLFFISWIFAVSPAVYSLLGWKIKYNIRDIGGHLPSIIPLVAAVYLNSSRLALADSKALIIGFFPPLFFLHLFVAICSYAIIEWIVDSIVNG